MYFDTVRLVGAANVDLPLQGVGPLSPFVLKAADGLGPPEVDVSIATTLDVGGVYQGRRPQLREPVLRIGLQPEWNINQTPEQLRAILYGLLTPKYGRYVELQIRLEDVTLAKTEGHVKKLEVATFSKDPEVQVTLACIHPYLYAPAVVKQLPAFVVSGTNSHFDIDHIGTAPTGFIAQFVLGEAIASQLVISDNDPLGEKLKVDRAFGVGDVFTVDTRAGSRGIYRAPASAPTAHVSILSDLNPTSDWIQLHAGINSLKINTDVVSWTAFGTEHTPTYWGV